MSVKNKNGERIIIGISEVHLAELEKQDFLKITFMDFKNKTLKDIKDFTGIDFETCDYFSNQLHDNKKQTLN